MKRIFSFTLFALLSVGMFAQEADAPKESAWKFDGSLGVNAAATGNFNWTSGGKNSVTGFVYAKLHLLYHKDAMAWETNFDTDFGLTWRDQKEDPYQKSSDNIKLATKFGWEFKENWYLTVSAGFQSQYALGRKYQKGYDFIHSNWLAPSYTDISVGIDWKTNVKGCDFSVYLSPVAGRVTTAYVSEKINEYYTKEEYCYAEVYAMENAKDDAARAAAQKAYDERVKKYESEGGYTAAREEHWDFRTSLQEKYGTFSYSDNGKVVQKEYHNARVELGLSFKGGIAYSHKDFKFSTTLALFTPYQGKGFNVKEAWIRAGNPDGTPRTEADWNALDQFDSYFEWSSKNRYFGNFDIDWDLVLGYQFLKCLQINFQANLKYYPGTLIADSDENYKERIQFKGVLGIGVGYSF